jgi:hypothetical protein
MADNTEDGQAQNTLPLLYGAITLDDALEEEENMLIRLSYPDQRFNFFVWIV